MKGEPSGDYRAVVTTPSNNPALDWDLRVKLTWDRADRRDQNGDHVVELPRLATSPPR